MNLIEAAKQAKETGKAFKRPSWNSAIIFDDGEMVWESSGETVDMTPKRLTATDYIVVDTEGDEEDAEITCVYENGRWRTTTNPERHRAAGRKVATFVHQNADISY